MIKDVKLLRGLNPDQKDNLEIYNDVIQHKGRQYAVVLAGPFEEFDHAVTAGKAMLHQVMDHALKHGVKPTSMSAMSVEDVENDTGPSVKHDLRGDDEAEKEREEISQKFS